MAAPHRADCPFCGEPLRLARAWSLGHCGAWKCRSAHESAERDRYALAQQERRLARATATRAAHARREGIATAEGHQVVVIPANTRPLTRLPRRRRYRFAKRLLRLVRETREEASDRDGHPPDEDPAAQIPLLATACATCRGSCCEAGGSHAFLDKATIRRFLRSHPQADDRDVVAAFCRQLPDETYAGSCVFHSATGCGLPRTQRSATCRTSVCGGVSELKLRIELDGETKFFLAAIDGDEVLRSTFEDSTPKDPSEGR